MSGASDTGSHDWEMAPTTWRQERTMMAEWAGGSHREMKRGRDAPDLEGGMRDVVDPELGINVVDLGLRPGSTWRRATPGTVAPDRHDLDPAAASVDGRDRGSTVTRTGRLPGWSTRSRSTGCGIRRGGRTRSPRTAASNCAPLPGSPSGSLRLATPILDIDRRGVLEVVLGHRDLAAERMVHPPAAGRSPNPP